MLVTQPLRLGGKEELREGERREERGVRIEGIEEERRKANLLYKDPVSVVSTS
jgi:hypothetical protein